MIIVSKIRKVRTAILSICTDTTLHSKTNITNEEFRLKLDLGFVNVNDQNIDNSPWSFVS